MTTDLEISKACEAITQFAKSGRLKDGDSFTLKDLFDGVDWNNIEKGERLHLGRTFKRKVLQGDVPNVCFDETAKGCAHYIYKS